ncbi:unnamed protein product [Chrysoparadoxa australica]
MDAIKGLIYTGGSLIVVVAALLYRYQGNLLYFPTMPVKNPDDNPIGLRNPAERQLPYDDVVVEAKDGAKLHGWLIKQKENADRLPTLIYFHGNAGNIGFRLVNAGEMYALLGCNIFLVEYRGYGKSEGQPDEDAFVSDAGSVVRALTHPSHGIDSSRLVLFGRSLGGAVALAAAEALSSEVQAVIVENTFLSISHMVDLVMPIFRHLKPWVLTLKWNNQEKVQRVTQPIMFISGSQDELIPPHHMMELHRLASSRHKVWYSVAEGTHNDTWLKGGEEYYRKVYDFLRGLNPTVLDNEFVSLSNCSPSDRERLQSGGIPIMKHNKAE